MSSQTGRGAAIVSKCCATAGVLGSLACSISMTLAAIGIAGAAVSAAGVVNMPGMSGGRSTSLPPRGLVTGVVDFLVHAGPVILPISIAAIALAFGIRQPAAVIPALAAGTLMYWGMYLQPRLALMYAAVVLGFFSWAALFLWSRGWQLRS